MNGNLYDAILSMMYLGGWLDLFFAIVRIAVPIMGAKFIIRIAIKVFKHITTGARWDLC